MIGFIVTNNRITNRTADFFNSPIAFWLCFYLNTAFHMAVISPTCMFSVSTKLSIRADNGTCFGSFFHYPAYHLVTYGQGRPQKVYDTVFYTVLYITTVSLVSMPIIDRHNDF